MNNMFSRPLLGTDKKKTTMTWFEYIFTHLIPTWFSSFNDNFRMWRDLVTGDYEKYTLLKDDDPFQECYDWFWSSINLDETYPKEFLEYLLQMCADIDSGKVETVPLTEDFFDRLKDLVEDVYLEDEDLT
jgi:hypothetical protein